MGPPLSLHVETKGFVMTDDEQRFWDQVFVLAIPTWTPYVKVTRGWGIAEYSAIVADAALKERRERQKTSAAA